MSNLMVSLFWWWANQGGFLQPEKRDLDVVSCVGVHNINSSWWHVNQRYRAKYLLSQERKREREQSDCQPINCKYEPLHLLSTILWYITHYNGPCGWDHLVKQSSASITAHTRVYHILHESTTSFVDLIWNWGHAK